MHGAYQLPFPFPSEIFSKQFHLYVNRLNHSKQTCRISVQIFKLKIDLLLEGKKGNVLHSVPAPKVK